MIPPVQAKSRTQDIKALASHAMIIIGPSFLFLALFLPRVEFLAVLPLLEDVDENTSCLGFEEGD